MKKIVVIALAAIILAGCSAKPRAMRQKESVIKKIERVDKRSSLSMDEKDEKVYQIALKTYKNHPEDELGKDMFAMMVEIGTHPEESIALFKEASEEIRADEHISKMVGRLGVELQTTVGCMYVDIAGEDAKIGGNLNISSMVALGKPVLVDFWASWCNPCRREIKEKLLKVAAEGKVNVLGIAVWEKSIEDTRKAMSDLGIKWPVIYTGGREDTPSELYGVSSIPTMILIGTDGKIIARGHTVESVLGK